LLKEIENNDSVAQLVEHPDFYREGTGLGLVMMGKKKFFAQRN